MLKNLANDLGLGKIKVLKKTKQKILKKKI